MQIRLRARRTVRPDVPPDRIRELLRPGPWGWEPDPTVLGLRNPELFHEARGYCEMLSGVWSWGTESQVGLLASRLEGLRTCSDLVALLRGALLHPGRSLRRELLVAESYLDLVESEVMTLTGDGRVITFWDGRPGEERLVDHAGTVLDWDWDALRYGGPAGGALITGWVRRTDGVVALTGERLAGLHELSVRVAPLVAVVRVERRPLRDVWGQWLQDVRAAATFAGEGGILGTDKVAFPLP